MQMFGFGRELMNKLSLPLGGLIFRDILMVSHFSQFSTVIIVLGLQRRYQSEVMGTSRLFMNLGISWVWRILTMAVPMEICSLELNHRSATSAMTT
jgi:hypothetical protein